MPLIGSRRILLGRKRLWTPLNLGSSLVAWWDASYLPGLTFNGLNISAWTDRKSGIVASQATGANQPGWSATARNGKPGLSFNGTSQFLSFNPSGLPQGAAARSVLASGYLTTGGDRTFLTYGSASNSNWLKLCCNTGAPFPASFDLYTVGTTPATGHNWPGVDLAAIANIGASSLYISADGSADISGTYTAPNTSGTSGFIGQDVRGGNYWSGYQQQIIVCNGNITSSQKDKLYGWEAWNDGKAGSNLPAGNPYKSRPPYVSDPG